MSEFDRRSAGVAAALVLSVLSLIFATREKPPGLEARVPELGQRLSAAEAQLAKPPVKDASIPVLENRVARAEARLDKAPITDPEIPELQKRISAAEVRFSAEEAQITVLRKKFERMEDKLMSGDPRIVEFEKKLAQYVNVPEMDSRITALEKRVTVIEATLASAPQIAPAAKPAASTPAVELGLRERELNIGKTHTEYARQLLLREVCQRAVRSAKTFLELTTAREQAGQVTKLDVFNAEVQFRNRELKLVSVERLIQEAIWDFEEVSGGLPANSIAVPPLDFGFYVKESSISCIESDEASGRVSLITKEFDKIVATKVLFQATRVSNDAVTKTIESAPADERPRLQRRLNSRTNALRCMEKGLLIKGQTVEQAKRMVEAAQISFDRGLKDSFDVIRAEDDVMAAQMDFINFKMDYESQLTEMKYLLGK